MLPYATLISIDKSAKAPVFLQIAGSLSDNIRQGIIPVGAQLPGSRAMASILGLHRKTVAVLFKDGDMQRHLKKAQKVYHARRDLFCDMLQSELGHVIEFSKPTGGSLGSATRHVFFQVCDLNLFFSSNRRLAIARFEI